MTRSLALAAVFALLGAGQALAHARLLHASPKVGSTVKVSPSELELFFSETIVVSRSSVTLQGAAGGVSIGPLRMDPADARLLHAPVRGVLAPGSYRVQWAVTSTDTHNTAGDFTFRVGR